MDLSFLQGKRTYIVAVLIGILSAVKFLGWVDEDSFQALLALLTGSGLAALRASK